MPFELEPLLSVTRAPGSGGRLKPAPEKLVKTINEAISTGNLVDQSGTVISEQIESGLVDHEKSRLFPVRGGIAILVSARAIELSEADAVSN